MVIACSKCRGTCDLAEGPFCPWCGSPAVVARIEAEQDRAVVWCVRWCTYALASKPSQIKRFGHRLTWHLERCRDRMRWAGVGQGAIQA